MRATSDPGYVIFHRESAVYAQAFDAGKLAVSGEPVRVADEVTFDSANGRGDFRVSQNGVLAYFYSAGGNAAAGPGSPTSDLGEWQLAWIDRTGQVLETVGPPGAYRGVEVSPDAKRIAVHRHDANGGDIYVIEPRGSQTRLTLDATRHSSMPIWSPDGSRIVYASLRSGKWGLYQTLSSGSGTEEPLYESDLPKAPMSWSPDGKRIVFWVEDPKTGSDLWVLTVDDKKAAPLVATAVQRDARADLSGRQMDRVHGQFERRPERDLREAVPDGQRRMAGVQQRRRLAPVAQGQQGALLPFPRDAQPAAALPTPSAGRCSPSR